MDLSLATKDAMDCSSNDELAAMLECWFDPSDTETLDFLDTEFADVVAMDILPLDVGAVGSSAAVSHEPETPMIEPYETLSILEPPTSCAPVAAPHVQTMNESTKVSANKRPRRRSLTTVSPPRSRPRQEQEQQQARPSTGTDGDAQYNEMLKKLAASMKRSEASRANVLRQRPAYQQQQAQMVQQQQQCGPSQMAPVAPSSQPASATSTAPQFQSIVSLPSFFSGQRSTLTSGLEQSRRQLAAFGMGRHMSRMGSSL